MASMVVTPPRAHFAGALFQSPMEKQEHHDREMSNMVDHLKRRQQQREQQSSMAVATPPRERAAFSGDRGYLSPDVSTQSPYPQIQVTRGQFDHCSTAELTQELGHTSAEVQALRRESQDRQTEAQQLRQKVRNAELALKQASSVVSTWSTKVEAVATSRHAVLEASALHIDSQASGMRERLARMEYELAEKDKELSILRRAVEAGSGRLEQQHGHVSLLRQKHDESLRVFQAHKDHKNRLNRQMMMDDWNHQIRTNVLTHEGFDVPSASAREEKQEHIQALDEEMRQLHTFITHLEAKGAKHQEAAEQHAQQMRHIDNQDRVSAAQQELRRKRNKEQSQHLLQEAREIEARIDAERSHRESRAHGARRYDSVEVSLRHSQEQLTQLVACTRDCQRAIQMPLNQSRPGPVFGAAHAHSEASPLNAGFAPSLASPLRIGTSPLFGGSDSS